VQLPLRHLPKEGARDLQKEVGRGEPLSRQRSRWARLCIACRMQRRWPAPLLSGAEGVGRKARGG
jgi:hypothetical protein